RLVWEVEILEALLGGGRLDLRRQRLVELALLRDAREDGRTALLQFAQIAQALVELAKLRVVQPARCLLAVAGDEGNRRALVEELDRRANAGRGNAQLAREGFDDPVEAAGIPGRVGGHLAVFTHGRSVRLREKQRRQCITDRPGPDSPPGPARAGRPQELALEGAARRPGCRRRLL